MRPGETAALQVVSAELPGGVGGCSEPHVCGGLECATGLRGSTLTKTQMFCTAAPAPERPSREFCGWCFITRMHTVSFVNICIYLFADVN